MRIYNWHTLTALEKKNILSRPLLDQDASIKDQVKSIIATIQREGDAALIQLTKKFDQVSLSQLQVTSDECEQAFNQISNEALTAIEFAKQQITRNHQSQLPKKQVVETCSGVMCERLARPIESIGLYIPGGSAPLVSTILMLGVPAQLATCPVRILCTPPNPKGEIDPHLLVAAKLCGIESIYKVGGAQAIAAMAYGTETIPKVDKIYGPGNRWVTQAKLLVAEDPQGASIDLPAGPSELLVIADEYANPEYVAADLLSQAEHGADSQVMLITLSTSFAEKVQLELSAQITSLTRKNIISQSLANSRIIMTNTLNEAIGISNSYAPEHLILQVNQPEQYLPYVKNAGAIFLGAWTPEVVGDYVTGANHVLPTHGYARSYSGLSVLDFMKFISIQSVTRAGLASIAPYAEKIAAIEGLTAHQQAITRRLSPQTIQGRYVI